MMCVNVLPQFFCTIKNLNGRKNEMINMPNKILNGTFNAKYSIY